MRGIIHIKRKAYETQNMCDVEMHARASERTRGSREPAKDIANHRDLERGSSATEEEFREEEARGEEKGRTPHLARYLGADGVTGTKAWRAGGAVGSICVRNCATSTASRKVHTGGESASSGVAVSTLRMCVCGIKKVYGCVQGCSTLS